MGSLTLNAALALVIVTSVVEPILIQRFLHKAGIRAGIKPAAPPVRQGATG